MPECSKCEESKPVIEFYTKQLKAKKIRYTECKKCFNARMVLYRETEEGKEKAHIARARYYRVKQAEENTKDALAKYFERVHKKTIGARLCR